MRITPVFHNYDTAEQVFHCTIVGQFTTALPLPHIRVDTPLDTTINLHFNFGLAIVVVIEARLAHRWRHPVRVAPEDPSTLSRSLAIAMHRLFYAILLIGPSLTGAQYRHTACR